MSRKSNYRNIIEEIVDGVTLSRSRIVDRREIDLDISPNGWRPILCTPKDNAPMWVHRVEFSLSIPDGELGYGITFHGELVEQADIDRRERESIGRGRSVRYLRRYVKAEDVAERANWMLEIIKHFRPHYAPILPVTVHQ